MKKRKELNALIGLGDSKRKKTKKGSGHRLLRTEPPDSESESSSEDDGFSGLSGGGGFGKRSYTQCCNVCYPLFLFIILAACVMACAGLIWMQIALKEDLDSLKEKLHSMESSQKASSSEIPRLSEELKNKQRKLDELENGGAGLNRLWSNLTEMNRKISVLDSAVSHLKANLKSAADLISLPTTVEELQKSVATIGSTLTSVQHDVQTMQDAVRSQRREQEKKTTTDVGDLRKALSDANRTEEQHHTWTDEQIHILLSTVADLHHRVASLENGSRPAAASAAAEAAGGGSSPASGGGSSPAAAGGGSSPAAAGGGSSPAAAGGGSSPAAGGGSSPASGGGSSPASGGGSSPAAAGGGSSPAAAGGGSSPAAAGGGSSPAASGGGSSPAAETEKEATTVKSSVEDAAEVSPAATSRRPRFVAPVRVRRLSAAACPHKLLLPGVTSLRGLEELLRWAAPGPDPPGLTRRDLSRVLGPSAPSERLLGCFDRDGDRRLSLSELRAAAGL